MNHKRRQSGYATVFTIAFFAAIALAIFSLYDVGWVASERIRLQNTADNTVYSTVNVQTRDLNMIAITNRAMIANQVVIGQYIGLVSWSNELNEFGENLETVGDIAQVIPVVGKFIERATEALAQATGAMVSFFEAGDFIVDQIQERIIGALSEFQRVNHALTLGSTYSVYQDVLKRNDPNVSSSVLGNAANIQSVLESWGGDIKRFDRNKVAKDSNGGDNRTTQRFTEFANLVNDSRDRFSGDRSYRFMDEGISKLRVWFQKNGGSDFVPVEVNDGGKTVIRWNWTAADTLSFYTQTLKLTGWDKDELPMGWGAAHTLNEKYQTDKYKYRDQKDSHRRNYDKSKWTSVNYTDNNNKRWWGNSWSNDRAATLLRYQSFIGSGKRYEDNNIKNTKGLRNFYDFESDKKTDSMPSISVFLSKNESGMRTQKTLDESIDGYDRSDRLIVEAKNGVPGNNLWASASAQSFFSRPDESHYSSREYSWNIEWGRSDSLHEYGNLYNPFWQSRLVDESNPILSILTSSGIL